MNRRNLYAPREKELIGGGTQHLHAYALVSMKDALLNTVKGTNIRLIDKLVTDGIVDWEASANFIEVISKISSS
jgi:hypothetical protein